MTTHRNVHCAHPWLALAGLWLWVGPCFCEPVIIHEQGPTRPIGAYLPQVPDTLSAPPPPRQLELPAPELPLRTEGVTPGRVQRTRIALPQMAGLPPVFLVGSDPQSLRWLAAYRSRLVDLGAIGLLIQADSQADIDAVRAAGAGLQIAPVDAAELVRTIGLTHYPVLISSGVIEQ